MHHRATMTDARNIVVRDSPLEVKPQQDHDGFRNICAKLETASSRLRYTETGPENLLALPDFSSIRLNKVAVDFRAHWAREFIGFHWIAVNRGHGFHLTPYVVRESSQLSARICTYLA